VRVTYRGYQGVSLTPIWVLLILNVLFFLASLINRDFVLSTLGLHPISPVWPFDPGFFEQPWTIVTNLFLHGSWMHILFNMLALFFLGSYVLRVVGEARFLIVYFLGGLLGNILLLALAEWFPFRVAIGASGAVFALGGTLAIMRPKLKVIIFPIPIPMDLWIAVVILMAVSFAPFFTSSNVAWQAHLGGLLLGLIAGYFFRRRERQVFRS
jgi:membrane associated rhomboid family serine protease